MFEKSHHRGFILLCCILVVFGLPNFSLQAKANTKSQIIETCELATHTAQQEGKFNRADSLNVAAIKLAKLSMNKDLIYLSVINFLRRDHYATNGPIDPYIMEVIQDLDVQQLQRNKKFDLWIALIDRLYLAHLSEDMPEYSRKILAFAASSDNLDVKFSSYLAAAKTAMVNLNVTEAWQYILDAETVLSKQQSSGTKQSKLKIQNIKFEFYDSLSSYRKALDIKKSIVDFLIMQKPIDSIQLAWSSYELYRTMIHQSDNIDVSIQLNDIIRFAKRKKIVPLEEYAFAIFRMHLINAGRHQELFNNFFEYYQDLAKKNPDIVRTPAYCQSNAIFCEVRNNLDSAQIFFEKGIAYATLEGKPYRTANLKRRYAQFLLRNDLSEKAYEVLQGALDLAIEAGSSDYIMEITEILDTMAIRYGDTEKAFEYSQIQNKALKKKSELVEGEALLLMELEHRKHVNELKLKQEKLEAKRKHNIEYFAIGVGLILLFLLFVIISSMKVPNWLIQMLGFFSILFVFEFVILILDHKIHHWAHGAPVKIFLVKIAILSILFPLHHVAEHGITTYMVKHQLIKRPKKSAFRNFINKLYPWMDNNKKAEHI